MHVFVNKMTKVVVSSGPMFISWFIVQISSDIQCFGSKRINYGSRFFAEPQTVKKVVNFCLFVDTNLVEILDFSSIVCMTLMKWLTDLLHFQRNLHVWLQRRGSRSKSGSKIIISDPDPDHWIYDSWSSAWWPIMQWWGWLNVAR